MAVVGIAGATEMAFIDTVEIKSNCRQVHQSQVLSVIKLGNVLEWNPSQVGRQQFAKPFQTGFSSRDSQNRQVVSDDLLGQRRYCLMNLDCRGIITFSMRRGLQAELKRSSCWLLAQIAAADGQIG